MSMTATRVRTENRFGTCGTECAVRDGKVNSTVDPAGWHNLCPGSTEVLEIRDPKTNTVVRPRRVDYCNCPNHVGQNRCRNCKRDDMLLEEGACADVDSCAIYRREQIEANPRHRVYQDLFEKARQERADDRTEKASRNGYAGSSTTPTVAGGAGEPTPKRERKEPKPTSGRCEHCGQPTKGGKFVAGHDAQLKGVLLRAAREGDVEAYAEMVWRRWDKESHVARHIKVKDGEGGLLTPQFVQKAKALASAELVAARVAERIRP